MSKIASPVAVLISGALIALAIYSKPSDFEICFKEYVNAYKMDARGFDDNIIRTTAISVCMDQ